VPLQAVEVVPVLPGQLGQQTGSAHGLEIHLDVLRHRQLLGPRFPNVLGAEHLAGLVGRTRLGLIVMDVDFPVLPLAAVLILDVAAVTRLETAHSSEFDSAAGKVGPE
jgi:hypothetical protein